MAHGNCLTIAVSRVWKFAQHGNNVRISFVFAALFGGSRAHVLCVVYASRRPLGVLQYLVIQYLHYA